MTSLIQTYKTQLETGDLQPDPVQEKMVDKLQALLDKILEGGQASSGFFSKIRGKKSEAIQGLYAYGGVGRGKSMVMDMFFDCLPDQICKRRIHFHAFMIEVHDFLHAHRQKSKGSGDVDKALPEFVKKLSKDCQVLCFDEFHVADIADAMILGRLFRHIFEAGIVVVTTSNRHPDDLYKGGLQRDRFEPFIATLKNHVEIFHLDSETDYRLQAIQAEGKYFCPLNTATKEKMDEIFSFLTGGAQPEEEALNVKGRKLLIEVTAKGIARISFTEFCEKPYGAEDYLKLAKTYPTILLENIPKMGYDRRNEAKRLMTLIDNLYEQKSNLIVSADAPPDKLYYGDDHAFEFQRTVSRLIEMQSENFGKG